MSAVPRPPIRRVVFAEDAVGRFGGVETLLRLLAPRLREQGLAVEYLSHEPPAGPAPTPDPVRCFAVSDSASRVERAAAALRRRAFLAGLGARDALVMMNETTAADLLPGLAAARRLRPRGRRPLSVMQFHSRFDSDWRRRGDAVLRRAAAESDVFLAQDGTEARRFAQAYDRPVGSIPNPVAVPLAGRVREHLPERVLCVARLAPEKRVDWVLRAFDAAAARHPGWELQICGDGPERARLQRLAAGLEHGERISFRGEVPLDRLAETYDGAGLVALASAFEGTPMVLAEALARGVPVVCTPSSAAVEETARAAGFLSEDDPASFARTLEAAMSQDGPDRRRLSAAALDRAARHDPEAVLARWLELFGRGSGRAQSAPR